MFPTFEAMSRKVKLIWEFFGEDAEATANHHAIHLREYSEKQQLESFGIGTEKLADSSFIAYLKVSEENMITVRDSLRPKRGEWVEK